MGKKIDMTGWKMWEHGVPDSKITVLYQDLDYAREHNLKHPEMTYWRYKCSCGVEKTALGYNLRKGMVLSCGCLRTKRTKESNIKDLTGQKFGKLTAIKNTGKLNKDNGSYVWECKCDCGNIHYTSTSTLMSGQVKSCGCLRKDNSIEKYKKDLKGKKFGLLTPIEVIKNYGEKGIYWRCKCECGNYCNVLQKILLRGESNSCGCLRSVGELKIKELLKENNISFEEQKRFDTCRSDKNWTMPFDFYVDNKFLVEFDGEQHYKNKGNSGNNWWDSNNKFLQQKRNDEIKNDWCKTNNIPLKRIPYWKLHTLSIEDIMGDRYLI